MSQILGIIGGGIIGLHSAIFFKQQGWDVVVLEKEPYWGHHTSTRNSGVVHAGIYYEEGSLKESLCLAGNSLTLEWLKKLKVSHQECGKWIIPGIGQTIVDLESFYEKLKRLPLKGIKYLSASELAQKESALKSTPAILIPQTAILDAAEYIRALVLYAEQQGILLVSSCEVLSVENDTIKTTRDELKVDLILNTAGHWASDLASKAGVEGYTSKPCRGDYYLYSTLPLSKPVYHPMVKSGLGLGVHLTPTFDGQLLLGPNAYFIDDPCDYNHRSSAEDFQNTLRDHIPVLPHYRLNAAYSGNRPKLFFKNKPVPDFTFIKKDNWIHCLGIESPGLTSAPAIAKYVYGLV